MAEGFVREYMGERFDVHSAGTDPKDEVHPLAVRVMREAGIDISSNRPRSALQFLGKVPVRHILIVCDHANGTCPRIWPGVYSREYMPFEDPAAFVGSEVDTLEKFREIRDQIGAAMKGWTPGAAVGVPRSA